jgi:hypothetical protein
MERRTTSTIASKISHLCCICCSNTAAAMHLDHLGLAIMHGDGAQVLTAPFLWILQQFLRLLPKHLLSQDCMEASEGPSLYAIRWQLLRRTSTSRPDQQNMTSIRSVNASLLRFRENGSHHRRLCCRRLGSYTAHLRSEQEL